MNSFGWQAGRQASKHCLVVWSYIPLDRFFSASMKIKEIIQYESHFKAVDPITPRVIIINIAMEGNSFSKKKKSKNKKKMNIYLHWRIGDWKIYVHRRESELIKVQRKTKI